MTEKKNIEKLPLEAKTRRDITASPFFKLMAVIFIISSIAIFNLENLISYYKEGQLESENNLKTDHHESGHIKDKIPHIATDPSEDTIEAEIEKEKLETMGLKDAGRYRLYLSSIAKMASKFYANIDYENSISYLTSSELEYPVKVKNALQEMKKYREKYLTHGGEQYKQITLEGNIIKRLINKIVNIRQENPLYHSMEEAKKNLYSELNIIEEYFYSEEFLKYCLNYD